MVKAPLAHRHCRPAYEKVTSGISKVGIVVIGRNEGERLRKCLQSVIRAARPVAYVDSGSTDCSVRMARVMKSEVVELDCRSPFTAARARNEGFKRLRQMVPNLHYVQFVDGDCEVVAGWIEKAVAFLDANPDVAVVCGRRRERYPAQSVYNFLCDIEWNTPIGETKACGGDALIRVNAFEQIGGYRAEMIAGEDPELCVRLRAVGWRIWRLDAEMTLHEAAMTRFGQWWRRTERCGYAFALGAHLHGTAPAHHCLWEARRAWLWGIWFPVACVSIGLIWQPWGWLLWLIYPLQILRQTVRNPGPLKQRIILAWFQMLSRFPQALGQIRFLLDRLAGRRRLLIEYK